MIPFSAECYAQGSSLRPDPTTPTVTIDGLTWELNGSAATLIGISKDIEGVLTIPTSFQASYDNSKRTYNVSGRFNEDVFKNLKKVTEIHLPHSFYKTGSLKSSNLIKCFEGCDNLKSLTIDSSNLKNVDGVLYYINEPFAKPYKYYYTLWFYPSGKTDEEFTPNCLYSGSAFEPTYIAGYNFAENHYLKKINVPNNYSIGGSFANCHALEEFYVSSSNAEYASEDGILMNKDKTKLKSFPPAKKAETFTVPSHINSLSGCSFYGNNVSEINIKENVTDFKGAFEYYTGKVIIDFIPEQSLLRNIGTVNNECTLLVHGINVKDLPSNFAGKIETFEDVYIMDMVSDYFGISFQLAGCDDIDKVSVNDEECTKDDDGYYVANNLLPNSAYTAKIVYNINGVKKSQEYEINTKSITTTRKDSPSFYLGKIVFSLGMNDAGWDQSKNPDYFSVFCKETQKTYNSDRYGNFSIESLSPAKQYTFIDVKGHWGDKVADVPYVSDLKLNTKTPEVTITASATDTSVKISSIKYESDNTWTPSSISVDVKDNSDVYLLNGDEWKDKTMSIEKLIPETYYNIIANFHTGDDVFTNRKSVYTTGIPLKLKTEEGPTSIRIVAEKDESSNANVSKIYFKNQESNILEVIGLKPGNKYSFNLSIEIKEGRTFNKTIECTTPMIEWSEIEAQGLTGSTSRISTTTNISEYETGAGFQWKKYDAPESLKPSEGNAAVFGGKLSGVLKNLQPTSYYLVRAFYKDADGVYYTSEWTTFDPSDFSYFEPDVHTYPVSYVSSNEAAVRGYVLQGSEEIEEQGFEYWPANNSTLRKVSRVNTNVQTVISHGQMMSAILTDLNEETEYIYRSFAVCGGKTTYGEEMSFKTVSSLAGIESISKDNNDIEIIAYYSLDGKRYSAPQRGFNIVVYSNGKTEKLIMK